MKIAQHIVRVFRTHLDIGKNASNKGKNCRRFQGIAFSAVHSNSTESWTVASRISLASPVVPDSVDQLEHAQEGVPN